MDRASGDGTSPMVVEPHRDPALPATVPPPWERPIPARAPARMAEGPDDRGADRELVEAVRRREPGAGQRLYDGLITAIDGTIARTLGPGQPEHDDLVQATFEQLVVTLTSGTFRFECSLKSWAASIASHLALNAIRSRSRERAVFDRGLGIDDGPAPPSTPGAERTIDVQRKLARLRAELAAMNEERARAIVLFHFFECDLKQVAGALGISVAAAQSRVVRGRRELMARMCPDLDEQADE